MMSVPHAERTALGAREALTQVMSRSSRFGEHLTLIEMLLAVGPTVRDAGALEDALDTLDSMEKEIRDGVRALREVCGAARPR